jgi:hypothetical protein
VYGKLVEETGAVIMGRRSYDNSIEAWGGKGSLGGRASWSERKQESWTARQLPASHTTTSTVKLISKGGAQNAFITTTLTTTSDADGVPSVTEDGVSVDCRG